MSEYDWHPVVALRWSVTGTLQQQFKRRVSNSRGVWYDEYEWRDVPRQPVDDIPLIKYPAQETRAEHETSTSLTSAEEESLRERSDLMHKPAEH